MKKYFIITLFCMLAIISGLYVCLKKERAESKRLSTNQRVLLEDIHYYKTQNGLNVASIERLEFTKREFEKFCEEQKKIIDELNIKIACLESFSTVGATTNYQVQINLKDSIVLRDSLVLIDCISYNDSYLTINGCIEDKIFKGAINSRDTLIQVVHRVPKRFWFIKWGTKAIRQEVLSKNPYTMIDYTEYITIR